MYHLIESTDRLFLEELSSALLSFGVNAKVYTMEQKPDGKPVYSVICPILARQFGLELLNYRNDFLNVLGSQSKHKLLMFRRRHSVVFTKDLTFKKAIVVSITAATILCIGLLVELFI